MDHLRHLYDDNLYGGIQGSGRKQFFSALGKVSAGLTTVDVTQLPSSAFIKPCQTMLYHTMCLQKGNFHHCTSDALGPSRRPKKQDLDVPNHVSPLWQTSPLFMHHHHAYGRDKNHLRKRVLDLPNHVSVLWYLRSWVTTILTGITRVTSLRVLLWNGTYLKIVLLWYYPDHRISFLDAIASPCS